MEHWFHGEDSGNKQLLADAAAFNIELPDSMLKANDFEVWFDNEEPVLMFLRCQTQWRTTMSGVIGLDYGVILQMLDLYAVKDRPQVMEDLQVMESRAVQLINEQAEKASRPTSKSGRRGR